MTITLLSKRKQKRTILEEKAKRKGKTTTNDDDDARREKGRGFLSSVSEQNNVQSQASHPLYHPLMGGWRSNFHE